MKNLPKFAIAAAALLASGLVSASSISLTGTLRDMSKNHDDFENAVYSGETGLVKDQLGVDGTPVFDGGANLTTALNFSDWYSTGTNHSGEMFLVRTIKEGDTVWIPMHILPR